MSLEIVSATYGDADVKSVIESKIANNAINVVVGNYLFGDPKPFVEKYLCVKYLLNGSEFESVIKENDSFVIDAEVEFMPISAKCITYGRVSTLEETLYSFLNQDYEGESELIICNDYPLQKLHFDHPRVRIYNLDFTFETLGEKDNFAVSCCKYQTISMFDDDDIAFSNYFSSINKYFKGYELLHWAKGVLINDGQISAIGTTGNSGIVWTKNIWKRVGGHAFENAGFDMTYVNKIKKAGGRILYAAPPDDEVCWGYYWANRSHHSSGLGADDGSRPNVVIRHSEYIESLRQQGLIPTGDIELKPKWSRPYDKLLKEYINAH